MFLECRSVRAGSRISKRSLLSGRRKASVLYILEQIYYAWQEPMIPMGCQWLLHILGSSKPASPSKKYLAASGGALGGSDHLYMLICLPVSAAVSNEHASMTLRCLYYTCLLTAIGQDTNYILLAWVFPWPNL